MTATTMMPHTPPLKVYIPITISEEIRIAISRKVYCNDIFLWEASEESDELLGESEDADVMSSGPGEIDIIDTYM